MAVDLIAGGTESLERLWAEFVDLGEGNKLQDFLADAGLVNLIRACVNSKTKTYRYVLPTQLIAKHVDPSLDCRCLQAARPGRGSFDARTVAHQVIVPFDQANESVLGGAPEPYVNNPVRVPEVSVKHRAQQKNKADWDKLGKLLSLVQSKDSKKFTESVLKQVLTEIYRRLAGVRVIYATPSRISLPRCVMLMTDYLGEQSGGDRLLALSSALFAVIGKRFRLYSSVRRAKITASDLATGLLADLECVTEKDAIVLTVEVKDKELTISQMRGKIKTIREKQVSEIFFIAQRGVVQGEKQQINELINREFVSGQNIYMTDLISLAKATLALLGERGRKDFLREVGHHLEAYKSDINHRRAWATLLASV
ncbi:MAG: restriction endonuclease, SacI family [Gammaproteobacteria bacterium]